MEDNGRNTPLQRTSAALSGGGKAALRSLVRLFTVLLPLTLGLALLDRIGALAFLDRALGAVTGLVDLPGSAIVVIAASALIDIYAAVAVIVFISLDLRSAVILAVICVSAHSLIRETALMRKAGSSGAKMVLLRLAFGLGSGWGLSVLLPPGYGSASLFACLDLASLPAAKALAAWAVRAGSVSLGIAIVVIAVGALKLILQEFKGMLFLSKILAPFMRFLGLHPSDSLYWVAANVAGYPYCAGLITGDIESGKIKRQDGDLLNHNALLCHALIEDTAFFMVLGLPLFWLVIPRLVMATALTWIERIRRHYVRRSFRAGVA